jgi:hypothetical protein
MSYIAQLKERVQEAEAERDYYKSLVEAFFNGFVEDGYSSLNHMILAQAGRKRLAEKKSQPALLHNN